MTSGNLIGTENTNLILDTLRRTVVFGNGDYGDYTTNPIIENLHVQVDDYGRTSICLSGIIDFRLTPDAVPKSRGWTTFPSGIRK